MKPRFELSKWLLLGAVVLTMMAIALPGCASEEVTPVGEEPAGAGAPVEEEPGGAGAPAEEEPGGAGAPAEEEPAGAGAPAEEEPAGVEPPLEEEEVEPESTPTHAPAPAPDQSQTSTPGNTGLEGDWMLSQGFIPSVPVLASVEVYIGSVHADISYPLTLQIRSDNNGLPSGTILASTSVTVAQEGWEWITFSLPDLPVNPGTGYHLVLYSVSNYHTGLDSTNPYPHGYMGYSTDAGATWKMLHDNPDYDMAFRIYGPLSEETVTPAPALEPIEVELEVDSTNPEGVKFIAPESGSYTLTIVGGAYHYWGIVDPAQGFKGWRTLIDLYINRPIDWGIPDEWGLHPVNSDRTIGLGDYYSTFQEAQAAGWGSSLVIHLDKNDYIITIVSMIESDPDYYFDNTGAVKIRISGPY